MRRLSTLTSPAGTVLTVVGLALLAYEVARTLSDRVLGTLGTALLWAGVGLLAVGLLLLVLTVREQLRSDPVAGEEPAAGPDIAVPGLAPETMPAPAAPAEPAHPVPPAVAAPVPPAVVAPAPPPAEPAAPAPPAPAPPAVPPPTVAPPADSPTAAPPPAWPAAHDPAPRPASPAGPVEAAGPDDYATTSDTQAEPEQQ